MTVRRSITLALMVAMIAALAGCNLPIGRAGARCSVVGRAAQDKTYVLTCNKKHRYQRLMTLDAANALVGAYLRAHAPTTSTTTTTAPPVAQVAQATPLTAFGDGTDTVGSVDGQIEPGLYFTDAGTGECTWVRSPAGDTNQADQGENDFSGTDFMQLTAGDAVTLTGGCTWTPAPTTAVTIPATGDATYRVGIELQPGWYHLDGSTGTGVDECFWEVDKAFDGLVTSIDAAGFAPGPELIHVLPTDKAVQTRDCGQLTQRDAPTRSLILVGGPDDPVLGGDSYGYDQTEGVTASIDPTSNTLTVTAGPWTVVLAAPTGQPLAAETYTSPTFPATAITPGLSLSGTGIPGCLPAAGSNFTISDLTVVAGQVTALDAQFFQQCDPSDIFAASFGSIHIGT